MDKIAVIGSNSFSGSHFIRYALSFGHEVIGISRSNEINKVFLPYKWEDFNNFRFYKADLNKDIKIIFEILKNFKPNYIINFAALGMVAQSWEKPEDWYQTNIVGQVKLHDRIRKFKWLKRYLHVTTPEVYGDIEGWKKEDFNFRPSTPYAVSRASCDLHLMSFYNSYDFPVVFTRAANVYGPGQQLYRIIPRTILCSFLKYKLDLHGGGLSERSFIHIDDVVNATYKILIDGENGETYHISTKKLISIKDLVKKICEQMGGRYEDLVVISGEKLGKDKSYMLDSEKVRQEFNWKDITSLDSGITDTLEWVKTNLDVLKNQPHKYFHKS